MEGGARHTRGLVGGPIVAAAQGAITYVPPLQALFGTALFGTASVPFWDGLLIVGMGVMLFVILEIEKQLRLWMQRKAAE